MQIRQTIVIVACFVVAGAGLVVQAQNTVPVGTWKLDPAKSTYKPGPAPKSVVLKIEAAGMGATTTVDAVAADGSTQHWAFTGNYDGKDVPITGNNPNGDTAARKRVNATTTETTYRKGGKITTVNTSVLSADGQTLTISVKGTDAQGRTVNNVQVYERQ